MKLVELLAKELAEWPEACKTMTQDADGDVNMFEGENPKTTSSGNVWLDDYFIDYAKKTDKVADDYSTAIVTRAQWQAERDRQKGGEWKRHRGGKCPVDAGQKVGYKFRGGDQGECLAGHLMWDHQQDESDVMKYRVIIQPQAEEVEYRGPFPCAPIADPENAIEFDIEFPSGVFKLEAQVDQIDGPIKWRDTIIHCQAIIEDCEREIAKNENLLALEGFALIPDITPVMGVADIAIPLSDWKVGDIVEVISVDTFCDPECKIGDQMPIIATDDRDGTVKVVTGAWGDEDNYRFIRRP